MNKSNEIESAIETCKVATEMHCKISRHTFYSYFPVSNCHSFVSHGQIDRAYCKIQFYNKPVRCRISEQNIKLFLWSLVELKNNAVRP